MILVFSFGMGLQSSYYEKSLEQKMSQVQLQCNMLANQVVNANFLIDDPNSNLSEEVDQRI